jgi:hypothetical protein
MAGPSEGAEEHLSRFERFEEWYFAKSKAWMAMAVVILVIVWILTAFRDVNETTLANLIVTGVTGGATYQGAITIETLVSHSTEQSLLLAMSFFKLAIGGYIYLIVRNLEKTSRHARRQLAPDLKPPRRPFFRNLFPRLLVFGTDIQLVNVGVIMVLWDLNALNLLHLQFIGQTTGAAYAQASTIELFVGTLVNPVEMLGATFMLVGIPLGLASIVYNLRTQLRFLPALIGSHIATNLKIPLSNFQAAASPKAAAGLDARGLVPGKTLAITIAGLIVGASGLLVVSPVRTLNLFGVFSQGALFEKLAAVTDEQWLFVGLALAVFSINLWLRHIVRALEDTREVFGKLLTSATGSQITLVERGLWPYRAALPFATVGFLAFMVNFGLGLFADSAILTQASFGAASGSPAYQQAVINQGVALTLAANLKFFAFGFLLTGIGLYLVTIIINLRQTAATLLNVFPRVISYLSSGGRRQDNPETVTLAPSMSFAPWKAFALIAAGAALGIIAFFPLSFIGALSFVQYQTLGFAGQSLSPAYSTALLAARIFDHTLLPLKLTGLGIMLLGVGRTFGVIVGFVKARTTVIREFVDSLVVLNAVQAQKGAAAAPALQAAFREP